MRNKLAKDAIRAKKQFKMQELRAKALEEERRPVSAAIKQAILGHAENRHFHHYGLPAHAPWASVVNKRLKSKDFPPVGSNFCKFIGISDSPITSTSKLISDWIKIYNRQNPGSRDSDEIKKKIMTMLNTRRTIGLGELNKILSK